ncbi:hypothetical protein BDZ91DRAFT_852499 [Kalaharituber pfeilii]|nr:hypothetical protein BDZ91DRAFT_852499 [Kalaharituber pfeilii]
MTYRVRELAKTKGLDIEITTVTRDAPGSIKIRLKNKEQALKLENLKVKLDKEIYVFGPEFSLYVREVAGIRQGAALVRLKRVPRQIPKTIPAGDWNMLVVAPTSSTRGKCPLCGHKEHKGGCLDTIKYDPKMSAEGKARVEALRAEREVRRKERKDKRKKLRAELKLKKAGSETAKPKGQEMEGVEEEVEEIPQLPTPPIPAPPMRSLQSSPPLPPNTRTLWSEGGTQTTIRRGAPPSDDWEDEYINILLNI